MGRPDEMDTMHTLRRRWHVLAGEFAAEGDSTVGCDALAVFEELGYEREEAEEALADYCSITAQIVEDTCAEHGVFCCGICFDMDTAP